MGVQGPTYVLWVVPDLSMLLCHTHLMLSAAAQATRCATTVLVWLVKGSVMGAPERQGLIPGRWVLAPPTFGCDLMMTGAAAGVSVG